MFGGAGALADVVDPKLRALLDTANPDDVGVVETAANAVFTVTRSGDTGPVVTVDYASSDGTAAAGTDYTAVTCQLSFGVGVIRRTIAVPILRDMLIEWNEVFNVTLSNSSTNATLSDELGEGTIFGTAPPAVYLSGTSRRFAPRNCGRWAISARGLWWPIWTAGLISTNRSSRRDGVAEATAGMTRRLASRHPV